MKRIYIPPTLSVVKLQNENRILIDSVRRVGSNVGFNYGGGGNVEAVSKEDDIDFDEDLW